MSFASVSYYSILRAANSGDWDFVQRTQAVVSHVFAAMQDDPGKFADLQRAKVMMGLGQPITREVTSEQIERVFAALDELPATGQKWTLLASLRLLPDGPYDERLHRMANDCYAKLEQQVKAALGI